MKLPRKPRSSKSSLLAAIKCARIPLQLDAALHEHCLRCSEEIRKQKCDVLYANTSAIGAVSPIGGMLELPSLLYLQEPSRHLYEAVPTFPWAALPPPAKGRWWSPRYLLWLLEDYIELLPKRIAVRDERKNAAGYKRILVNSAFSSESVMRAYGLETEVCKLGVDAEKFKPDGRARERFVVGLGDVSYHKGVDRAVLALGSIPQATRPPLIWIGNRQSDSERKRIEDLAKQTNVCLEIKIGVTEKELITLLGTASVMIYTSRLEPFGFAPLEAGACETPVVAVAEGGIRETIINGKTGILVPSANPKEAGKAVLRLLDDRDLARSLGTEARKYIVRDWSWRAGIDALERHLKAVIQRSA